MKKFIGIVLISLFFIFYQKIALWASEKYQKFHTLTQILNLIENNYIEKVDVDKLIIGGIKGVLTELDPHTIYLPKKDLERFKEESNGEYGGLGINITIKDDAVMIIAPIEDSPAWKAGLKAGDRIIKINGQSIEGDNLLEVSKKLKGKRGTKVRLTVVGKDAKKSKDIVVRRGVVKLKSVKHRDLDSGYIYLRITSFSQKTSKELKGALKKYNRKTKKIKGLILDLRNNPGGFLDQAVKVSDMFLEEGVIVSTMGRDPKNKKVFKASPTQSHTDFPIVVIINPYSASASEIVAGALRDNKRALIIGERSFGKGSVQTLVNLDDGTGLKLTIARYYTPKGVSIQAEGVAPDIVVGQLNPEVFQQAQKKSKKDFRESNMKKHLRKKDGSMLAVSMDSMSEENRQFLEKDYQLLAAYRYVKAVKTFETLKK